LAWIFLLIAAAFETAWTFSLKFMSFTALKAVKWQTFYEPHTGLYVILPFVGYILFGVGNVYFFSLAIKHVPTAIAYAVWTACTLVMIKISEVAFLRQRISWAEIFFMLMIMGGIMGLRYFASTPQ
jgi:quaternary ammonium compound-resistance protein SugE